MRQEVYVLDVVVCLLGSLCLAPRLARVNPLENAEPPAAAGSWLMQTWRCGSMQCGPRSCFHPCCPQASKHRACCGTTMTPCRCLCKEFTQHAWPLGCLHGQARAPGRCIANHHDQLLGWATANFLSRSDCTDVLRASDHAALNARHWATSIAAFSGPHLKVDRCSCSFLRACVLVTYCTALPALPCTDR